MLALLAEALEEADAAVAAQTLDPAEAIPVYRGIAEMAAELAVLAAKVQLHAQRQFRLLLLRRSDAST